MPKGVIIPQRLAAQFWRMNSSAACFSCPVTERTNQPNGRKVSRAVSLVRSMEPNMVMTTSAVHTPRTVEKVCTIRWERAEKTSRSRSAPTTARTLNRQERVLRS